MNDAKLLILEQEYTKVKADIKVHMNLIKASLNTIQDSRQQIEVLGKRLTELQQQYLQLKEIKNENK